MSTSISWPRPTPIAAELYDVERQLEILGERKEKLREALLNSMKRHAIQSVKTEGGVTYSKTIRKNIKILDKSKAFKWGLENPEARMKLDTSSALKALDYDKKLKTVFGVEKTEYLRIMRPKEHETISD